MEERKSSKALIVVLSVIIVLLSTLVILLGTGVISFKKSSTNTTKNTDVVKKEEFTKENAESKLKELYGDAVRGIFNEKVAFCGSYDNESVEVNGYSYKKSSTFKSFDELDKYVKKYMTEDLLATTDYNKKVTLDTTITSYYGKDGSLYCNNWNKGGNPELAKFLSDESTYTVSNLTEDSFDGTISAVYSNDANTVKTTKNIKVSVIKQNNNWLINSYVEE